MDVSSTGVPVATSSPLSPVAEESCISGDYLPKTNPSEEDSKIKEIVARQIDSTMLMLEDSTLDQVPPHLENLLSSFDMNNAQPADLLIALIYCVALECSFAAVDEVQRCACHIARMSYLSTFHSQNINLLSKMPDNIYDANRMSYNLRLQLMFDNAATSCVLTGIVTGDLLILTLTPDCGDAAGKSICLSIGRYVLNSKGRPFPSRFRKLPELSYKLRELVLIPIRNHMIKKEGRIILYPGLDGMPEELYPFLYMYMNKNGLNKMANVSRRLRDSVMYFKKHMLKQ